MHVSLVFAAIGLRHQYAQVLANDFLLGMSELPDRRGVEGDDRASVVLTTVASGTVSNMDRRCASRPLLSLPSCDGASRRLEYFGQSEG